jgi:ferritin-like protein
MSSESLHAPREKLSKQTLTLHYAIVSLKEELDAVDWYRQRADDCPDKELAAVLLHNMREEMEHATMVLEWIRRNNSDFDRYLRTYLFTEAPITEVEDAAEDEAHGGGGSGGDGGGGNDHPSPSGGGNKFTVGSMKKKG